MPEARNPRAVEVSCVNGIFNLSHVWNPPFGPHSGGLVQVGVAFQQCKLQTWYELRRQI